jgi:putative ABC transport system permease protein
MKFLIQVYESLIFAYQALRSNILRTTLSLLGVSVGIFAIVAVFTAVDSLNKNIRSEIDSFAGSGVLYVGKWPWIMQNNYPWWKYLNRPEMKYTEFQFLKDNLKLLQKNFKVHSFLKGKNLIIENKLYFFFNLLKSILIILLFFLNFKVLYVLGLNLYLLISFVIKKIFY